MNLNTARCGCGAIVQLPSLKARAYSARCDACIGRVRDAATTLRDWTPPGQKQPPQTFFGVDRSKPMGVPASKWDELKLPAAMPVRGLGIDYAYTDEASDAADAMRYAREYQGKFVGVDPSIGREKNARIDACKHDFTSVERACKTQLDVARLNVFRLESQYVIASPQEQRGVGECLTEARKELAKPERSERREGQVDRFRTWAAGRPEFKELVR